MNLKDIKLKQKLILNLYKKLLTILEKHKIPFFAVGGTAIGALREKGFIPGDDDLDIAIHEKYIKKLKEVLRKEKMITKDIHSNTNTFLYEKVFDKNVLTKSKGKDEGGLGIDIFGVYENRNVTKKRAVGKIIVEYILYIKTGRYFKMIKEGKGYLLLPFTLIRMVPLSKKKLRKIAFNSMTNKKYISKNGKLYLYHNTILKNFVYFQKTDLIKVPFEDTYIYVTKKFAKDSKQFFGDIYVVPDKKQRFNHNGDIIKNEN